MLRLLFQIEPYAAIALFLGGKKMARIVEWVLEIFVNVSEVGFEFLKAKNVGLMYF